MRALSWILILVRVQPDTTYRTLHKAVVDTPRFSAAREVSVRH
jgi:hypothetical protein